MTLLYECRPSFEDDRPQIDFKNVDTAGNDWHLIGEVLDGVQPADSYPSKVLVRVSGPLAGTWDFYRVGGTRGLFSQRVVDIIGAANFQGLRLLPAQLNGDTYYFLRCEETIDCFDRDNAVFEVFRSKPTAIKRMLHYAFREDRLPSDGCFCIPEVPDLLVTQTAASRLNSANLKGLNLVPLP